MRIRRRLSYSNVVATRVAAMRRGPSPRGLGLMAIAVALGMLIAPAAEAATFKSGFMVYVQEASPLPPSSGGTLVSDCPAARSLTGGGGTVGGPAKTSFPYTHIAGLWPIDLLGDPDSDPDDRFALEAYNNSSGAVQRKSYAACLAPGAGSGALSYNDQASSFNPFTGNSGSGMTVSCGGRTLGGGLRLTGSAAEEWLRGSGLGVGSNGKVDPAQWRTSFNVNGSQASPHSAFGYAICFGGNQLRVRYRYATKVVFGDQVRTLRVNCPRKGNKGWKAVGGGWRGFTAAVVASTPLDNKDKGKAPDDGWRVKVLNFPGGDAEAVVAFATCAKRK